MKQRILYIFTRTPLHIGAGNSVGPIDQPIVRERHTGFPIIPGSSLKGVLRDSVRSDDDLLAHEDAIFGPQDSTRAGTVSIGEGKILAFPVRSAKGSFAFITCPLALERFLRQRPDLESDKEKRYSVPDEPKDMTCRSGSAVTISKGQENGVVLEEYRFNKADNFPALWEKLLLELLDDPVWQAGKGRFVLLSNGDFAHFVKNACEVSQHVGINPETGTAKKGALFNLEAVPAETLFFASITPMTRAEDDLTGLEELFLKRPLLQLGGDGTTGLGFCSIKFSHYSTTP